MPLYEYECESCGRRFELIRKFSDPPLADCPHCGKGPVRKLLSSPAFQFKGSGFYITDYPKSGKSGDSEGSKGDAAKPTTDTASSDKSDSASTGSKSDVKPDAKPSEKTEKASESKPTESKSTEPKKPSS